MTTLSTPQRGVVSGIVIGLLITGLSLALAVWFGGSSSVDGQATTHRLALCLLAPAAALLVCIARLAKHRFVTAADIEGSALTQGTPQAKHLQSLLQNTLEQSVLAALVYTACSFIGEPWLLSCLPVAAVLFLVGRILFFIGYSKGAAGRALGFVLTFYPTVILCVGAIIAALMAAL